jgi:maleate isomerase
MRLGVLIPSTNVAVEEEFRAFAPEGVSIHAARAHLIETTIAAEERMLEHYVGQAAVDLGTIHPDVVVFNCTTAAAILGAAGEQELVQRIASATGAPVVTTNSAVHRTLRAGNAKRVAVLTPYIDELTERVAQGIEALGMHVPIAAGMGIVDPFAISEVEADAILHFVKRTVGNGEVDTVFLSCANLRALPLRLTLERLTGCYVVTSNHAALTEALRIGDSLGVAPPSACKPVC